MSLRAAADIFRLRHLTFYVAIFCASIGSTYAQLGEIKRTTFAGLSFDAPVFLNVRGQLFRVPAGYFTAWPSPATASTVNITDGFGFNFWMPEKRYVEVPDNWNGFRPRESGRKPAGGGSYVVRVNYQARKPDELKNYSPETRFKNLTSIAGLSSYAFELQKFGLVRFWQKDWPYPKPEPFNFRHAEGADPQVMIGCNSSECHGYVYFVADEVLLWMLFPEEGIQQWQEIMLAVRELTASWKIKSP